MKPSKTKKSNHPEEIEITFLRSDDSFSWPPEEPTQVKVSENTNIDYPSYSSLDVNVDKDSVASHLSSVSSLDGPIEDIYCKRGNSPSKLRINNRTRIEPTILNNFLDCLSMCFWKCSTGCQQLPDKHY